LESVAIPDNTERLSGGIDANRSAQAKAAS